MCLLGVFKSDRVSGRAVVVAKVIEKSEQKNSRADKLGQAAKAAFY